MAMNNLIVLMCR